MLESTVQVFGRAGCLNKTVCELPDPAFTIISASKAATLSPLRRDKMDITQTPFTKMKFNIDVFLVLADAFSYLQMMLGLIALG